MLSKVDQVNRPESLGRAGAAKLEFSASHARPLQHHSSWRRGRKPAHVSQGTAQLKGVEPMVASAGNSHAIADQLGSDPMMRRDPSYVRDVTTFRRDSQVRRAPSSAGLYEVLDLILDKGIVIDAFV